MDILTALSIVQPLYRSPVRVSNWTLATGRVVASGASR